MLIEGHSTERTNIEPVQLKFFVLLDLGDDD